MKLENPSRHYCVWQQLCERQKFRNKSHWQLLSSIK